MVLALNISKRPISCLKFPRHAWAIDNRPAIHCELAGHKDPGERYE